MHEGCRARAMVVATALGAALAVGCTTADTDGRWAGEEYVHTPRPPRGRGGQPDTPSDITISDMGLREVALTWGRSSDLPLLCCIQKADSHRGPFEDINCVPFKQGRYVDRGRPSEPLRDNAWYYYRLVAIGTNHVASWPSGVFESRTAPPPKPPQQMGAQVPAGRTVRLMWSPSTSEGVVRYIVRRARSGDVGSLKVVAETELEAWTDGGTPDTDLEDSTEYVYSVMSANRAGAVGRASKPVVVMTPPPPSPVVNFTAVQREVRCVPLSWRASSEEDVTHYRILRSTGRGQDLVEIAQVEGRSTTSYIDGGSHPGTLEDGRIYYYGIQAVNHIGVQSDVSDVIFAATRDRPPVVRNLEIESEHPRRVPMWWSPSCDEKVVAYQIERAREGKEEYERIAHIEDIDARSYVDTGSKLSKRGKRSKHVLEDGDEYRYRIAAMNTSGVSSDWSPAVKASTKPCPDAPRDLTFELNAEGATVNWTASPQRDVAIYQVWKKRAFGASALGSTETTSFTIDAAQLGKGITLLVSAVDVDDLESERSAPLEIRVPKEGEGGAP